MHLTPQRESMTLCLQGWENVLGGVHREGGVLTGSMTSTFLTDGSGATVGQSESSWYPVALLLRLWERVPSWKRSRSERRWPRRWNKRGNKSPKMKKSSKCTKAGGTSGGGKRVSFISTLNIILCLSTAFSPQSFFTIFKLRAAHN